MQSVWGARVGVSQGPAGWGRAGLFQEDGVGGWLVVSGVDGGVRLDEEAGPPEGRTVRDCR